jgi:hypothetical protein
LICTIYSPKNGSEQTVDKLKTPMKSSALVNQETWLFTEKNGRNPAVNKLSPDFFENFLKKIHPR